MNVQLNVQFMNMVCAVGNHVTLSIKKMMNGKLVKTSVGCVGVSKVTVVNTYRDKLVHRVVEKRVLTFQTLVLRWSNVTHITPMKDNV